MVIADLNAAQARAKAARIGAEGGQAVGVACDITNPELCECAAQAAADRFGRLDGVVNCAGISEPHDSISLAPAEWARMVEVQLNGVFYAAQACRFPPPGRLLLGQSRRGHAHQGAGHRVGRAAAARIKARIPLGRLAQPAEVDGGWLAYGYL